MNNLIFAVAHNCHGKTNFTHSKTKLTHGKTKLTHGKTKFNSRQNKENKLVSSCYLHLKWYVV